VVGRKSGAKYPRGERARWAKLKLKDAALRAFFLPALVSSFLPWLILRGLKESALYADGRRRRSIFRLAVKWLAFLFAPAGVVTQSFYRFIFHCAMKAFLCLLASH
jgi:hypothetical protein